MVIAAWEQFRKTPQWHRKKRCLKLLVGKEIRLRDADYRIFAISEIGREVLFR